MVVLYNLVAKPRESALEGDLQFLLINPYFKFFLLIRLDRNLDKKKLSLIMDLKKKKFIEIYKVFLNELQ